MTGDIESSSDSISATTCSISARRRRTWRVRPEGESVELRDRRRQGEGGTALGEESGCNARCRERDCSSPLL